MATSTTFNFNPSLGELTLYAFNLCGIRNAAITQEHMFSARMATNMLLTRWSNQGVNLWAVDLQTINLVQGQANYPVLSNTVVILDAYVTNTVNSSSPIDRIILPISRTEYASYPNKAQQGFPTVFWHDRLASNAQSTSSPANPGPQIYLWPTPDGTSAQTLNFYRLRQAQDSNFTNGQTVELPYLWLEAFAHGLAQRLATIWNPSVAVGLKALADESYAIASEQNVETSNVYISPQLSGYYS